MGLLGSVTGVFAQNQQQPQLTLTLSNTQVNSYFLETCYAYTFGGTVLVNGTWSGGPLHFEGAGFVVTDTGTNNFTIPSSDFSPQYLNYPSSSSSDFQTAEECAPASATPETGYYVSIDAYDSSNNLVGTAHSQPVSTTLGTSSSANLFILTMEIPLFQVPALGISASNPDFSNLFATFDQLPLGDFYMLLAEVAVILLVGAGLINVIMYLAGNGSQKEGTSGTLAGLSNVLVTLVLVLLLPYAYNAVAGFVNVLDQQIIAGPGNPYTSYLANSQLIWNTLPTGGNILTDFIGAIASLMAWVMSWLLGSARIFLIGAVTVAMPIVLVLRNIQFTARFAGVVEDTFFGLIFASVISALFIGLAAYILNHWNGSIFQAGAVDQTWVALAALLGAILAPTVFAPMTGVFFQTMSQVGMAAAGTAVAVGAGGIGPAGVGVKGGIAAAGQAVSGLGSGASFAQKAGAALGGFGGAFGRAGLQMGQNMLLMGTAGTIGGLGASRQASSIVRAIDLKMPGETQEAMVAHRAGMLAHELDLTSGPLNERGWTALVGRAFSVGVNHGTLRTMHAQSGGDLDLLRGWMDEEIGKQTGR